MNDSYIDTLSQPIWRENSNRQLGFVVADEAEGTGVSGWAFKKPVDPCQIIEKHPRHLSRENALHPPKMGLKDTQDVVIIPLTPNSLFCIFNLPQGMILSIQLCFLQIPKYFLPSRNELNGRN